MRAWLVLDADDRMGHFSMSTVLEGLTRRPTIVEVREVDLPEWLVEMAAAGALPVDGDYPNWHNDSTWGEWWDSDGAATVWVRDDTPPDQVGLAAADL